MTTREALTQILDELPDDRLDQLLDYARYLGFHEQRCAWQQFGARSWRKRTVTMNRSIPRPIYRET